MQRVGIYSGSFDPIHDGHIAFARDAIKNARLDKVFFLVEPRPRYKQGVKALEHRTEMVQRAIADDKQLGVIVLEQNRFTVHETWPILQARFAGAHLTMLMGDDVFKHLSRWPRIDELVTSADIVVGMRSNADKTVIADHVRTIEDTLHIQVKYTMFEAAHTFSSRVVRSALRHGRVPAGLNPKVLEYIKEQGLYSADL